jgi:arabinogalactan endo-1,4-beta-galactosidase
MIFAMQTSYKQFFIFVILSSNLMINAFAALSMLGADISSLKRAQELGQKYYNSKGQEEDAMSILKDIGVNYIRLRIWNDPKNGDNNKEYVQAFAKDIKLRGLKLLLDFHYSDTWADPKHQWKPGKWSTHNITQLEKDIYDYTYDVCNSLKSQFTTPDSVQIGNEIDNGMLWPEAKLQNSSSSFKNIGLVLKSGIKAFKDCSNSTKIIIHSSSGGNLQKSQWFFDGIKKEGVEWDITGLSFYCFWSGLPSKMAHDVTDLTHRYNKSVLIAETSFPYKSENNAHNKTELSSCPGYSATPSGQADNLRDIIKWANSSNAIGVFYWEPTWVDTPTMGVGWDNMAIFDEKGHINPLIKFEVK